MVKGNAGLLVKKSLKFHRIMDDIILAESDDKRPEKLTSSQRKRIDQVHKRANHAALVERATDIPNTGKLLKRIQDTLNVVIAKYSVDEATTIDCIKSEAGCARAYKLFLHDLPLFKHCLTYFRLANHNLALVITRRCTHKSKSAVTR